MSEERKPSQDELLLIARGVTLAQKLNDQIFQIKEFRKWPPGTAALAAICFGAASARVAELSREDYLLICTAAFDMIQAEPRTSEGESEGSDDRSNDN